MVKQKRSIVKSGISLSILTMLSRILGLVREMTRASFLGTSGLADAFTTAFQLPNLFRRLFAENSISVAFIPTFRGYLEREKENPLKHEETKQFVSSTFTVATFITAIFTLLGMLLAPFIIPLFTKNPDVIFRNEMTLLTRIMFPYLFVISVAAFFQGILNGVNIFSPSGFTPILFNLIVIIATYVLSPKTANPARAMAIGVILGGTVQALFQLPFILKEGWSISFTGLKKAFSNPGTKTVLKLIGPTIFGMAAYQLNDVVSMSLAGRAGTGIQSSLQYSLRIQELILGVFAVSIGTVILPELTGYAQRKDFTQFNKLLENAIRIIALITIPVTFYSFCTGENIIRLIYQSNKFTDESVALTLNAFRFHISGLFFIALNRIIAPAFYAQSNTKTPTVAGIISFGANVILAIVLVTPLKGGGIALALSLASMINTIVLFIFMKKQNVCNETKIVKTTILYTIKMILLSIIAVIPVFLLKPLICKTFAPYNRFIAQAMPLIITALLFALIGLFLLALTKDPLLFSSIKAIKEKLHKHNN